jgi:hypothetical protein
MVDEPSERERQFNDRNDILEITRACTNMKTVT